MSRTFFLFLLLLQPFLTSALHAQPRVAASIKPLQLIAAAVTQGISEPALIIGEGQDPHHPNMRPSERRILADADIVLWVGPELETALDSVIDPGSAAVISAYQLISADGLAIPDSNDPHVWLSTDNARIIARDLVQNLTRLDAANRTRYEANLTDFLSALDVLDGDIRSQLSGLTDKPFVVYHNAFGYFERQFGLRHIASFTESEELQPGVRRINEVRALLEANEVNCLLLEPGNDTAAIIRLSGRPMQVVSIDVLGFAYANSADAYLEFMRDLTLSLQGCLQA